MLLLKSFEWIGTIAFAISGAVIGVEKKLDLFGIAFLAIMTAVGGGIIRDIMIGNTPPVAFVDPTTSAISMVTALVVFFFYRKIHRFEKIIVLSDALGLGIFTAIGCRTAVAHGADNAFLVVAMGLSTGVGGGMLRDVVVKNIPFVLRKDIYAVASIIGAVAFYAMRSRVSEMAALYLCGAIVFAIRIVSVIYRINLPTFKHEVE